MAVEWNFAFSNYKLCSFLLQEIRSFFAYRHSMSCLSVALGREPNCSDFQYFSLTATVCFSLGFPVLLGICLSFRGLLCEYLILYYPTLFLLQCYAFCFFDRLIEIAGNRFPTYFDSDEKLYCMTRSVHLYRELTCDSVLKRYSFLEVFFFKKKDHFDWIFYNNIWFISYFDGD